MLQFKRMSGFKRMFGIHVTVQEFKPGSGLHERILRVYSDVRVTRMWLAMQKAMPTK